MLIRKKTPFKDDDSDYEDESSNEDSEQEEEESNEINEDNNINSNAKNKDDGNNEIETENNGKNPTTMKLMTRIMQFPWKIAWKQNHRRITRSLTIGY